MSTVSDELDIIEERLHDDGLLWSRAELLRWLNDGYRRIVAESEAVRRFFTFNVPPRAAGSGMYDWEERHSGGSYRKFAKTALGGNLVCSYQWEVETVEGISPTAANPFFMHLWELEYVGGNVDDHFNFYLSKAHETVLRTAWDDKAMSGTSAKELDLKGNRWWQEEGEPLWWLRGVGRDKSFEVFQIETTYQQAYDITGGEFGCPRGFSGSRTYGVESAVYQNDYFYTSDADIGDQPPLFVSNVAGGFTQFLKNQPLSSGLGWRFFTHEPETGYDCMYDWEFDMQAGDTPGTDAENAFSYWWEATQLGYSEVTFGVGGTREITSPDRQYLPMAYDTGELQQLGTVRAFQSSKDCISIWETIVHTRELEEDDAPALIPEKLYKYLRFYVWAMAFGRQGEGNRPALAAHYMQRFGEGVAVLKTLGNLTSKDRNYQRDRESMMPRVLTPMLRLPSTYPRVDY